MCAKRLYIAIVFDGCHSDTGNLKSQRLLAEGDAEPHSLALCQVAPDCVQWVTLCLL